MTRQRYGTPWWAQARDLEALEGRARAEAVWGTGYYADEREHSDTVGDHGTRLTALERASNELYALSALRQAEVAELAQHRHKPRY